MSSGDARRRTTPKPPTVKAPTGATGARLVEKVTRKPGELVTPYEKYVLPNGLTSKVKDIQLYGQSLEKAIHEQSVTLLLEDEIRQALAELSRE